MAKKILSLSVSLILCLFLGACASSPQNGNLSSQEGTLGALSRTVHAQLKPNAKIISGQEPPTIKFVQPQGLAQKYGFKVGDYILKVNGREISSSLEFEKKLKLPPSMMEIEYKTKNAVNTKRVAFASETTRFGASTEIQNTPIVKSTSPAIAIINRGPVSIYCSSSVNDQKDTLFINTIIDSEVTKLKIPLTVTVLEKKSKKSVGSSKETIDAVSLKSVLISKKFSISRVPQEGLIVQIALDSQQFIFEFHE